jgi:DNA repair protein RadA/Sms
MYMAFRDRNDDDDDDGDDEYPDIDVRNFTPPSSFGRGTGRSAPSQRKAMATKASSSATVHVCTNCGSEFVKWMGRCPTCREWNTLQEFKVERSASSKAPRPSFGSSSFGAGKSAPSRTWLDSNGDYENEPVRVTDVYRQVKQEKSDGGNNLHRPTRLLVPDDNELNTVLGGGIMTGSLTLLGGDPGVGT